MDGTLWDSAAEVAESWNETVKKSRLRQKTDYCKGHPVSNGKDDGCDRTDLFPDLEEGERRNFWHSVGKKKMIISGYTEQLSTRIFAGQWNS